MRSPGDILEPNNLRLVFDGYHAARDLLGALGKDLGFVRALAGAFGPLARRAPPPLPEPLFPESRPLSVPGLAGKRIAVVASGGSGATASLVGVQRAFEDAGIEPAIISACSGSVLFASLWASGLGAEEVARFWLTRRTSDYVDPDLGGVLAAPLRLFRGFGGFLRGDAVERSFDELLHGMRLGQTKVPFSAVVWNIDRNLVEHLSTKETPTLTVARTARVAISIPIFVEPVTLGEHRYGDGGIVDIFPVQPVVDAGVDLVVGTNVYLPTDFTGEDQTGWMERRFSILRASGQLRYALYLELAREHARALGSRLALLHPVPYEEVRGAAFYKQFLDRAAWWRYMRLGYAAARTALERFGQAAPQIAA